MPKYLSIGQASKYLNVSIPTLRDWEKKGVIKPIRTIGNQRRYTPQMLDDVIVGGSGLNYNKKGLKELIHLICTEQCSQVVVNYQDRLVRFGFELIEEICQENDVELTVINQTKAESSNEELAEDVLSVITVYSAKLYGKRSHHNEKIIKTNQELFKDH